MKLIRAIRRGVVSILFIVFGLTCIVAQTRENIKGRVFNQLKEPVLGVTVVNENEPEFQTQTDDKGEFMIPVKAGDIVIFRAVGYKERAIEYEGQSDIEVVLEAEEHDLEEVVVVGYGEQKRVNLTGSVATIDKKQLEGKAIVSTSAALQGLAPGVTVTSQTGSPGGDGGNINIRGINSFGGSSNSPLVLIDGIEGSLDNVDINQIESISVLKDAASAAIYGSRAANGVILITTKRAEEKLRIEYKNYLGKQSPTFIPKVTDGLTYMDVFNKANRNDGGGDIYDKEEVEKFREEFSRNPKNFDWQEEILQGTGFIHNHHIGMMSSSDLIKVASSVNYTDQNGIVKNTGFKRYSIRNNMDLTPSEKVTVKLDFSVNNHNRLRIPNEGDVWNYLGRMPTNIPIRTEQGQWSEGWVKKNPVGFIEDGGNRKVNNLELMGSLSLNYNPVDWLELKGMFAPKYLTKNTHVFTKSVMTYNSDGSEAGAADTYTDLTETGNREFFGTYQATLNVKKSFDRNNLSLLLGASRETYNRKYMMGYRRNFTYDTYEVLKAGADDDTKDNDGLETEWLLVSTFGRFNYDYSGKYLFEANIRYDGTSRFIGDNRWSVFPSFSLGWRVSEEPFFAPIKNQVNEFKIRGSWGKLGNQNIGTSYYPFTEILNLGSVYMGEDVHQMVTQSTMSNPDLKWEETTMQGIGLDATLFNRWTLTFDYYNKNTDGILMKLNTSQLTGLNPPFQNAAKVNNKGWELSTNYNQDFQDFTLGVGFNISDVKNKIIDMNGQTSGNLLRQQEGAPINSIFGYIAEGLYQSDKEIADGPSQFGTLQPGDIRYKDIDGEKENGNQRPDGRINDDDKTIIGNTIPRYTYGINLSLSWKGVNFHTFLQGVGKVDGYLNSHYVIPAVNSSAIKPWQLDYWTEDNPSATLPRLSITSNNNNQNSTFWMKSAAYLRVKDLHLGYEFPESITKKIMGIKGLYFYLNGQNLFTKTDFYPGYDPEINYDSSTTDGVSLGGGNYYPQVKTYTFGINVNF